MSETITKSRIIVQSDWEDAFKDNQPAWVSFKQLPDASMIHGQINSNGSVVSGSEGFSVSDITKKSIAVRYDQQCHCIFVSSFLTFATPHPGRKSVTCLDVSPGGLAVSSDVQGNCNVWTTDSGEVRRNLEGHFGEVNCCKFFPSGIVILTGGMDTQLKIWSAETGQCAATLVGHKAGISSTSIVDRGRNIVSCSRDGTAKLWDCGTQTCLSTFDDVGGPINSCALQEVAIDLGASDHNPSEHEVMTVGKMLLLGSETGHLCAYGLHSKKQVFEFACDGAVNCCCFLSDNHVACGTQDSQTFVIDVRNTSQPLYHFKESRGAILSMHSYKGGCWASAGDGSCYYTNTQLETTVELSGPDCDPVYQVTMDDSYIYTCCRDGLIRKYRASNKYGL